jgi:hypothetical protein
MYRLAEWLSLFDPTEWHGGVEIPLWRIDTVVAIDLAKWNSIFQCGGRIFIFGSAEWVFGMESQGGIVL